MNLIPKCIFVSGLHPFTLLQWCRSVLQRGCRYTVTLLGCGYRCNRCFMSTREGSGGFCSGCVHVFTSSHIRIIPYDISQIEETIENHLCVKQHKIHPKVYFSSPSIFSSPQCPLTYNAFWWLGFSPMERSFAPWLWVNPLACHVIPWLLGKWLTSLWNICQNMYHIHHELLCVASFSVHILMLFD